MFHRASALEESPRSPWREMRVHVFVIWPGSVVGAL